MAEITRTIGRALGLEERAEALVAGRPRWAPTAHKIPGRGVLSSLGFEVPKPIADLAGDHFFAEISVEQMQLLDADAVVWIDFLEDCAKSRIEADPIYPSLRVAKDGRDMFLRRADPLQGALSFSTVLSLPYVIDELVPKLAAAVDGDPGTN